MKFKNERRLAEMTKEDRDLLKELANKCMPRKWKSAIWLGNEGGFAAIGPHHNRGKDKDWCDDEDDGNGMATKADSEFISFANPQAVLSLLEQIEKYESALQDIKKHMEIVAGPMMNMSGVMRIVSKALLEEQ